MKKEMTAGAFLLLTPIAFAAQANPEDSEEYQGCLRVVEYYTTLAKAWGEKVTEACAQDSKCRGNRNELGVSMHSNSEMAIAGQERQAAWEKASDQADRCMAILDTLEGL